MYRLLLAIVVFLALGITSAVSEDSTELSNADRFAFEILDPSMEFVWRSHRIRQKILARLGIPDEMELKTVPERTADFDWAREEWNFIGGPELVLYSNENEWIESISIPVNTQIMLPFGLRVGSSREDFVEKLELDEADHMNSRRIGFQTDLRTTFGPASIYVTIDFDDSGNSTRVTWRKSE
jgi:hypothetical protein